MADWWRRLLGRKPKPRGPVYYDVLDAETQLAALRMAGVHCYRRAMDAGATKEVAKAAARACRDGFHGDWHATFPAARPRPVGGKPGLLITYEELMEGVERIANGAPGRG